MKVYVQVSGGERFSAHAIRTREELQRILDFARIGSQTGSPRIVYRLSGGQRRRIAYFVRGRSLSTEAMRAGRSLGELPPWALNKVDGFFRKINREVGRGGGDRRCTQATKTLAEFRDWSLENGHWMEPEDRELINVLAKESAKRIRKRCHN